MVAPLMAGKVVKGVMAVWRTGGQPFTATELEFLVGLSLQATVAIENARLFAESQQRAAELATINKVSEQLGSKLELAELLELVGDQIRTVFKADLAYVALLEPASGIIHFPYQYGESAYKPLKYGEGLTSKIIASRKPLIMNNEADRQSHQLGAKVVGRPALSYLGVPISVGDTCLGVISVQSTRDRRRLRRRRRAPPVHDRRERRRRAAERAAVQRDARRRWSSRPPPPTVLQVISGSMADPKPVFEKILDSCERLFGTEHLGIVVVGDDGMVRPAAVRGSIVTSMTRTLPMPVETSTTGRAIRDRRIIQIKDSSEFAASSAWARETVDQVGNFAAAWVPMLWEDRGVGSIMVVRQPPGPFSESDERAAEDVCRPGSHRDPERAPVQRDHGGAGAPDRDRRGPERDQRVADRRAAGAGGRGPARRLALPGGRQPRRGCWSMGNCAP